MLTTFVVAALLALAGLAMAGAVAPDVSPTQNALAYCWSGIPTGPDGCYSVTQCGPSLNGGRPACLSV